MYKAVIWVEKTFPSYEPSSVEDINNEIKKTSEKVLGELWDALQKHNFLYLWEDTKEGKLKAFSFEVGIATVTVERFYGVLEGNIRVMVRLEFLAETLTQAGILLASLPSTLKEYGYTVAESDLNYIKC